MSDDPIMPPQQQQQQQRPQAMIGVQHVGSQQGPAGGQLLAPFGLQAQGVEPLPEGHIAEVIVLLACRERQELKL